MYNHASNPGFFSVSCYWNAIHRTDWIPFRFSLLWEASTESSSSSSSSFRFSSFVHIPHICPTHFPIRGNLQARELYRFAALAIHAGRRKRRARHFPQTSTDKGLTRALRFAFGLTEFALSAARSGCPLLDLPVTIPAEIAAFAWDGLWMGRASRTRAMTKMRRSALSARCADTPCRAPACKYRP